MALAFRLPDTDPPLELWYRLPPADLLELRAGPLVLAPSRRLDGRGHACTAAAARCAPFEVLHVKIRTADPAATGMLWASLRWRSAGTPADLHAAVSTRIGLAPGSRCD